MKPHSILFQLLIFEITSWYGRNFKFHEGKHKANTGMPLLIDLGVGSNYTDLWVNVDFYRLPRIKFWKKYKERSKIDLELDLRFPLPWGDNVADGVYSGHTLEHLSMREAKSLLKEIYRILKPGCWIRINVPDLEKYIDFYTGKSTNQEFMQFDSGCSAIHFLTQEWGHRSCWDSEFLFQFLLNAGFNNIRKVSFGTEGSDVRLIKEESVRKWETLVMEAQKPAL